MRDMEPNITREAVAVGFNFPTPSAIVEPMSVEAGLPIPGEQLGPYRLGEKLGEGGIGVVYRAENVETGEIVAFKILRPSAASSELLQRRFQKEARMLQSVTSPYVTRIIEADVVAGLIYIAMELVSGPSLGEMVRDKGRLDERLALALMADACRGMAAVHDLGIIHRDVKPDNLLIASGDPLDPKVKLNDFGLARLLDQSNSQLITKAGMWVGTPLYMAPEQFGGGLVDMRADVYSLGATLFCLLTGRPPFPLESLAAIAGAVVGEPAPAVDRINPAVSAATSALVARCLLKSPNDRPSDAGALLADIERLLGGAPIGLSQHPRMPTGSARVVEYSYQWELNSPPARLWPYVSNTERLNRAAGLPPVNYSIQHDPRLGMRRFAEARVSGMKMKWEEHPFEWVEGRRMGVLREFTKGPFVWFASIVELVPRGSGTMLTQTLRAEPRNYLGRLAARFELGCKSPRALGEVYRRIDSVASSTDTPSPDQDAFQAPTRLSAMRQTRLKVGLQNLVQAGSPADVVDILGIFLSNAADQEVARIRPLALARWFGLDEILTAECCLRAVSAGLLQLKWDIICPLCRIPSGRKDTLRELKEHESCTACAADFAPDFAESVEMVFAAHPEIRIAEVGTYCAGGPAHSPHVVAQVRLAIGERIDVELNLSPGRYRVRGPQLPWAIDLTIENTESLRRTAIRLSYGDRVEPPPLAAGAQTVTFHNDLNREVIIRIERSAPRNDALTAARATAIPAFRELFPGELLSPGQLVPASTVSLLLVEVLGTELLERQLGDVQTFHVVQAAFRIIDDRIRAEGGATVKTVDDVLIASFADSAGAIRAVLGLMDAVSVDSAARQVSMRASVHRGMAMVATLNGRLDYFGQTPRVASRLLASATAGQFRVSSQIAQDPAVEKLLRGHTVQLVSLDRGEHSGLLAHCVSVLPVAQPATIGEVPAALPIMNLARRIKNAKTPNR